MEAAVMVQQFMVLVILREVADVTLYVDRFPFFQNCQGAQSNKTLLISDLYTH
jgi:hypothetical protein